MKKYKRIAPCAVISLILAVVLSLSSCAVKIKPIEPTEEENRTVGTVSYGDVSFDVKYDEYVFVARTLSSYGSSAGEIHDGITVNYAPLIMGALYTDYIKADSEDASAYAEKEINALADELGGKKKYLDYLKENSLTDRLLRFNLASDYCMMELYTFFVNMGYVKDLPTEIQSAILDGGMICEKHIFIPKDAEDAGDTAREALEYVKSEGVKFDEGVEKYSADKSVGQYGYYVMDGMIDDRLFAVLTSLRDGEISGIVEDAEGYFIIKREETNPMYIYMATVGYSQFSSAVTQNIVDDFPFYSFMAKVNDFQKEIKFTLNEYGKSIEEEILTEK